MRTKKTLLTMAAATLGIAGIAAPAANAAPESAWGPGRRVRIRR